MSVDEPERINGGRLYSRLISNPSCHRMNIRPDGNRHSYFLRAKAPPRYMAGEDEGREFRKPSPPESSFCSRPRGSKSDDEFQPRSEDEDLANCLVMLSGKSCGIHPKDESLVKDTVLLEKGMFQCKACKKVFSSHQALGGHRASHKKVKGCFASKPDGPVDHEDNGDEDSTQEDLEPAPPLESDATRASSARKRVKMHECSVCRRVFSSGQALGGHKRCHWLTSSSDNAFISNFHDFQYDHRQYENQISNKTVLRNSSFEDNHQLDLNLNLPPAVDDQNHDRDKDDEDGTKSTRLCLQQKNGEEGCARKLRKVSDLRDMSMDGGWLQMGIASTTTEMR